MPALRNVKVDFVSLVDRAAVRDLCEEDAPMTFLLRKRDANQELVAEIVEEFEKAERPNP